MMTELTTKIRQQDFRAIARLITQVENQDPIAVPTMKQLHRYTGDAQVIGITGVMGAGKSSLIYELAYQLRQQQKTIGIIAIDPTSPFSGGALLGDRVRMMELSTDDGVFIRSMGTRGMQGGLTSSVYDVVEILDAAGMDTIIIETVGVGQDQIDIVKVADTTIVVLVPGLGDSIQTIKAGLMEIADIFVVNKSDRPGVEQTVAEIQSLIDLTTQTNDTQIPVVTTSIKNKEGINQLIDSITEHQKYLSLENRLKQRRRKRYEAELIEIIKSHLMNLIYDESKLKIKIEELLDQIYQKKLDPYSGAEQILGKILK